jgi:hypothetical protein
LAFGGPLPALEELPKTYHHVRLTGGPGDENRVRLGPSVASSFDAATEPPHLSAKKLRLAWAEQSFICR